MSLDCRYCPLTYISLLLLHGLALCASLLSIPWFLPCLVISVAIGASALQLRREFSADGGKRIHSCQINARESLLLSPQEIIRCELPRTVYWSEFLLVLRFKTVPQQGGLERPRFRTLLLLPASLSDADHSKLRAYLRFSGKP
ncbi:MAG: hypothetical protein MI746_18415 [Pseudomonadales bacterium]|nr:hypothetical protein [Pseudomonadales bacterium]